MKRRCKWCRVKKSRDELEAAIEDERSWPFTSRDLCALCRKTRKKMLKKALKKAKRKCRGER